MVKEKASWAYRLEIPREISGKKVNEARKGEGLDQVAEKQNFGLVV